MAVHGGTKQNSEHKIMKNKIMKNSTDTDASRWAGRLFLFMILYGMILCFGVELHDRADHKHHLLIRNAEPLRSVSTSSRVTQLKSPGIVCLMALAATPKSSPYCRFPSSRP